MQTQFSLAQLSNPAMAEAEKILRACVHCGFCTATCPTFVLLGDELDSPRGRIYLIKEMLEHGRPADTETVLHIDRCLSCLSCMTTCPSGVHYMHLVDTARAHIEKTYRRPWTDRLLRLLLGKILPFPHRFRLALSGARLARPLIPILGRLGRTGARLAVMLRLAPEMTSAPREEHHTSRPDHDAFGLNQSKRINAIDSKNSARDVGGKPENAFSYTANEHPIARVALLRGCAQQVLRPQINDAASRLLMRLGIEIVPVEDEGCCGALVHHLGNEEEALAAAHRNIDAWSAKIDGTGLDAIVTTASGCGTMLKDYGFLLRNEPAYAEKAAKISTLAKDVTELLATLDLPTPRGAPGHKVAYQSACSMQHGQKLDALPKKLLEQAGFSVVSLGESHLCCGSAGTYNILQPELAARLRDRKIAMINNASATIVATGNIGCLTQLASGLKIPIVHTVELLDLAYGGEGPA